MLSTSILSSPNGPRELLTMFAIDWAAMTDKEEGIYKRTEWPELSLHTILITNILTRHAIAT